MKNGRRRPYLAATSPPGPAARGLEERLAGGERNHPQLVPGDVQQPHGVATRPLGVASDPPRAAQRARNHRPHVEDVRPEVFAVREFRHVEIEQVVERDHRGRPHAEGNHVLRKPDHVGTVPAQGAGKRPMVPGRLVRGMQQDLARAAGNPAHRLPVGMVKGEVVRGVSLHQRLHHSPNVFANAANCVPHRAAGYRDGKRMS